MNGRVPLHAWGTPRVRALRFDDEWFGHHSTQFHPPDLPTPLPPCRATIPNGCASPQQDRQREIRDDLLRFRFPFSFPQKLAEQLHDLTTPRFRGLPGIRIDVVTSMTIMIDVGVLIRTSCKCTMEICKGGRGLEEHDTIVYNERYCPLCQALEKITYLDAKINELQDNE